MNLGQLKYSRGAVRRKRRLGIGRGSGRGGTCGRGTKGLLSRSGGKVHPWFEGGQMPLQRRLPKRGFKKRNPVVYQVVNLKDLERLEAGPVIDAAALAAKGLVKNPQKPVKLLGVGEIKAAYSLKVTAASRSAVEAIQAAGGSVELEVPLKEPKPAPELKKKATDSKGSGPGEAESGEAKGKKKGAGSKGAKASGRGEAESGKAEGKKKAAGPKGAKAPGPGEAESGKAEGKKKAAGSEGAKAPDPGEAGPGEPEGTK